MWVQASSHILYKEMKEYWAYESTQNYMEQEYWIHGTYKNMILLIWIAWTHQNQCSLTKNHMDNQNGQDICKVDEIWAKYSKWYTEAEIKEF